MTNVLSKSFSGLFFFLLFWSKKVCSRLCLQSLGKIKLNYGPCDADESNIHDSRGQAAHPGWALGVKGMKPSVKCEKTSQHGFSGNK